MKVNSLQRKDKQKGLLSPPDLHKKVADYKATLDALQERQAQLHAKHGNTLAVEYWLQQFADATERRDEAAIEPTVVKTLVEKIIVHGKTHVDIHFKCGVIITEELK